MLRGARRLRGRRDAAVNATNAIGLIVAAGFAVLLVIALLFAEKF